MTTTFVTVVRPPKADLVVLRSAVALMALATRVTFSWIYRHGRRPAHVKRTLLVRFGLLARHWSGCRADARAAADSWREGGEAAVDRLTSRLEQLRDRRVKDSVSPNRKRRNAVAARKAETALSRLLKELKGLPRWCFGGRRLVRQGRIREWRRRRDSQALFCGERGKRAGNEVAIWCPPPPDGMASTGAAARSGASAPKRLPGGCLRLRLPNDCARKYLTLDGLRFASMELFILDLAVEFRDPVTWRVKLLPRGKVQLSVTVEEAESDVFSDPVRGAVGVDLNARHVAVCDVSGDGHVIGRRRISLARDSHSVWSAAREVVARASARSCPIVLEDLDFRSKKAWLRSYGKRFASVLSNFRSRQFSDAVERAARRSGIEVVYVNPAWTTRLGRLKHSARLSLGVHHAAAFVIGRRGLGFCEGVAGETLPCTVECVSTSGRPQTLLQKLPSAWLTGGGRHLVKRGARTASVVHVERHGSRQLLGLSAGGGSPPAVGGAVHV